VANAGNTVRLWNREGGAADNPSRTVTTNNFNGLPVNNDWYLYARDREAGDAGYIDSWSIRVFYANAPPQIPDLVVSSLSVSPTSGLPGSSATVNLTVKNNGPGAAPSGTVCRIRLANSTTIQGSDPLLDTFTVGSLSSGQTRTYSKSVTIPSNTATGSRYMGATANATSGVTDETNEGNNQRTTPFTVTAPVQLPDLVVSSLSVSPTSGLPGSSAILNLTVRNDGPGAAPSGTVCRIRLASSTTILSSDPLLDSFTVGSLSSGQIRTYSRTVTIPSGTAASSRYMGATANATSGVTDETDEGNNQRTTPFTVNAPVQLPDLVVSSLSVSPTSGLAGSSATVNLTVRNNGPGAAPSGTVCRIRLASSTTILSSDPLLDSFTVGSLSSGQIRTYSKTVTVPSGTAASSLYMGATANATSGVTDETDEGNNQRTTPFTVSAPIQLPDLVVSSLSVSPTSGLAGSSATVNLTVKNNGPGAAPSGTVCRIRLASSTTIKASDPLLDTFTVGSLSSGQTRTYSRTVTIPSGTATSSRYMGATANATSGVTNESDEGNNQRTTPFTVTSPVQLPDLVVSSLSVSPTNGLAGSSATVTLTVKNNGSGAAPSGTVCRIRLASSTTIQGSDPLLDEFTVGALSNGQSLTYTKTLTIPSGTAAGLRYMGATANATSGVTDETNEGNNQRTTPFTVSSQISPPAKPTLLSPGVLAGSSSLVTTLEPVMSWIKSSGATGYGLYISDTVSGSLVYNNDNVPDVSSLQIPSGRLEWGKSYRWNMRAKNSSGWSDIVQARLYFHTQGGIPSIPTMVSPGTLGASGPILANLTPTMVWEKSANATSYNVAIRDLEDLSFPYDVIVGDISSVTVPAGKLEAGKKYRWNINAIGAGGESNYASALHFQTPGGVTNSPDLVPLSLSLSPSQVLPGGMTTVSFSVNNRGLTASNSSTVQISLGSSSVQSSDSDTVLFTGSITAIAGSETKNYAQPVTIPTSTPGGGTRTLWLRVDPGDTAGQASSNRGNDQISAALEIEGTAPTAQNKPSATNGNQYREDFGQAIPLGDSGVIPAGTKVYFEANTSDVDGDTVRMEVELRKLPWITGTTISLNSVYVSPGQRARTPASLGLAAGNYGWRYRVRDFRGAASNWVDAGSPDFRVTAIPTGNEAPDVSSFVLVDNSGNEIPKTNGVYSISKGTDVAGRAVISDGDGDPAKLILRLTPKSFLPQILSRRKALVRESAEASQAGSFTTKYAQSLEECYTVEYRVSDGYHEDDTDWIKDGELNTEDQLPNRAPVQNLRSVQLYADGSHVEASSGASIGMASALRVTGIVNDPERDQYQVEIAVVRSIAGVTPANPVSLTGGDVWYDSGSQFEVTFTGPALEGDYWWVFRFRDNRGAVTKSWIGVKEGSPVDFQVDGNPSPPVTGEISRAEILRRAKDMICFDWTPKVSFGINEWGVSRYDRFYKKGMTYYSMPYKFGGDASRLQFKEYGVPNLSDKTYVRQSTYQDGTIESMIGNDCAAFVWWAWGYSRVDGFDEVTKYPKVSMVWTGDLRHPTLLSGRMELILNPTPEMVKPGDAFVRNSGIKDHPFDGLYKGKTLNHVFLVEKMYQDSFGQWQIQTLEQTSDPVEDGNSGDDEDESTPKVFQAGRGLRAWSDAVVDQKYRLIKRLNVGADFPSDPGELCPPTSPGGFQLVGGGSRSLFNSDLTATLQVASIELSNASVSNSGPQPRSVGPTEITRIKAVTSLVNWLEVENDKRRPAPSELAVIDAPASQAEREFLEAGFAWGLVQETDLVNGKFAPSIAVHESTYLVWLNRAMSRVANVEYQGRTQAMLELSSAPLTIIDGATDSNSFVTHHQARVMARKLFESHLGRALNEDELDEICTARPFDDPLVVMEKVKRADLLKMLVRPLVEITRQQPPLGETQKISDIWAEANFTECMESAQQWGIIGADDLPNSHFLPDGLVTLGTAAEWVNSVRTILDQTSAPRLTQPENRTVQAGAQININLTAEAGSGAIYEWYRNGEKIGETTVPTWSEPIAGAGNVGTYQVSVRNPLGGVVSQPFVVSLTGMNYATWLAATIGGGITPETAGYAPEEVAPGNEYANELYYALGIPLTEEFCELESKIEDVDEVGASYLSIQFTRLLEPVDVQLQIQASGDLESWREVTDQMIQEGSSVLSADGLREFVTYRCPLKIGEAGSSEFRFLRLSVGIADVGHTPDGFALIPAGSFQMGNANSDGIGHSHELPVHTVDVSSFYMGKYEVTKEVWDRVRVWGLNNGYTDLAVGNGSYPSKGANHPVHSISWYDMVKWCNARSEKEGLAPCYTVGGMLFRTGESSPSCDWTLSGYRLPTEAEWEKAARGGLTGMIFAWGNNIKHSQANYRSWSFFSYDVSPTRGNHPAYSGGGEPYSSPVGSFAPNGYGIFDMSGNMREHCWDWMSADYYSSSPGEDPRGPSNGFSRVTRGGNWQREASTCRSAHRNTSALPASVFHTFGFRVARGVGP